MPTKISRTKSRRTNTTGKVFSPSELLTGELAVNMKDERLFSKNKDDGVFQVASAIKDAARRNIKDFRARMATGFDDATAVAAAYAATPSGGTIEVPPGKFNISAWPTGVKSGDKVKLWQFHGTTSGESDNQVLGVGSGADTQELFALGSKFILRTSSYADAGPIVRIDGNFDHTGGTPDSTINTFRTNTTVGSQAIKNFVWGVSHLMTSKGRGAGGQHVGLVSTVIRPSDALADGFGPRDQLFGLYVEATDEVEVADAAQSGSMVAFELDLFAHGTDTTRQRQVLSINIGKPYNTGSDGEVGRGINVNSNNVGSYFGTMYSATASFRVAAIDLTEALPLNVNSRHIRLPPDAKIGWTSGGFAGQNVFDIMYTTAGVAQFNFLGTTKMQVSDDATNGVKVWVGGQLRSLTVKAQSSLVAGDLVFVAGI